MIMLVALPIWCLTKRRMQSFGHFVDWAILDGNHRLAAAIYSEKAFIAAEVAGEIDHAETLFGISIE
jgi:hypothetical protein